MPLIAALCGWSDRVTIDQLGSLGEFISSIAVVISLIYLAVQVRHNSTQMRENVKALQRNEMNETMRSYSNIRGQLMANESLADIIVRARTDFGSLSESEKERVRAYLTELVWMNYHIWKRTHDGFMDQGSWTRGQKQVIASMIVQPIGAQVWKQAKTFLEPAYVEEVEAQFGPESTA